MKLAMMFDRDRPLMESVGLITDLERAGLDQLLVPESYTFDAISHIGFLASVTTRLEIGTGIINVFSRTAAAVAMTAAGCDRVSDGRFILGLGASGPQVIEGFHGLPFDRPITRLREYVEACRMVWRREQPLALDGETIQLPLPPDRGTGLGKPLKIINHPVRPRIPIWLAGLRPNSVRLAAEIAEGWLPAFFVPDKANAVWGEALVEGTHNRRSELAPLSIAAGGMLAIGEELVGDQRARILDRERPHLALYVGGMGARGKNFYNDICRAYGYEREAEEVQDLYLAGQRDAAAAAVPSEMLVHSHLVGPASHIAERLEVYRAAGVTSLIVDPVHDNPVKQVEQLRALLDA